MAKRILVAFFLLLALVFGGLGWKVAADDKKPTHAEIQEKLKKLRQERLETVRKEFDARKQMVLPRRVNGDSLAECSVRLWGAELAVAEKPEERIVACKAHHERMVDLEKSGKAQYESGLIVIQDYLAIKATRLQAEIRLLEEQARAEKVK
jgi:hypothetical protein